MWRSAGGVEEQTRGSLAMRRRSRRHSMQLRLQLWRHKKRAAKLIALWGDGRSGANRRHRHLLEDLHAARARAGEATLRAAPRLRCGQEACQGNKRQGRRDTRGVPPAPTIGLWRGPDTSREGLAPASTRVGGQGSDLLWAKVKFPPARSRHGHLFLEAGTLLALSLLLQALIMQLCMEPCRETCPLGPHWRLCSPHQAGFW